MSLRSIQGQRNPITFGSSFNVLLADTFVNGDLDVTGLINGTHDQGQNENNVWTGTQTYSDIRPVSSIPSSALQEGVNQSFLAETLVDEGVINRASTWSGTNNFSQPIVMIDPLALVPVYIPPINATDAVCGQYIADTWEVKQNSFLTTNNNWTGLTNTFNVLPFCLEPLVNSSIVTKNYADTSIQNITQQAPTIVSQVNAPLQAFGTQSQAVQFQLIGAGGGSSSGTSSSAGVSGGSGAQGSIILWTGIPEDATPVPGIARQMGQFSINIGTGGTSGTSGTQTSLTLQPLSGVFLDMTPLEMYFVANGGGAFNGQPGESGTSEGGTFTGGDARIITPYGSSNGKGGVQGGGPTQQLYGVNTFGWGASSGLSTNGSQGKNGGYAFTNYLDLNL